MRAHVEFKPYLEPKEVRKASLFRAAQEIQIQKYNVKVSVEFTEEERSILDAFNLWGTVAWSIPMTPLTPQQQALAAASGSHWPTELPVTLKSLAENVNANRQFDSSEEAIDFKNEVKTRFLPRIKELIVKHQNLGNGSETLEL